MPAKKTSTADVTAPEADETLVTTDAVDPALPAPTADPSPPAPVAGAPTPAAATGGIRMRVMTKGDGKIFKGGEDIKSTYAKGDYFSAVDQDAADLLMDRGYADAD